jgi:hypothetical protein
MECSDEFDIASGYEKPDRNESDYTVVRTINTPTSPSSPSCAVCNDLDDNVAQEDDGFIQFPDTDLLTLTESAVSCTICYIIHQGVGVLVRVWNGTTSAQDDQTKLDIFRLSRGGTLQVVVNNEYRPPFQLVGIMRGDEALDEPYVTNPVRTGCTRLWMVRWAGR